MAGRRRAGLVVVATALVALLTASCSNASSGGGSSSSGAGSAPGVTANAIHVASLATASGSLSAGFVDIIYGVQAYFDMVNAEGGVDGRKIIWDKVADDTGSPTVDTDQARNLVEQDHEFAIVGVGSPFFSANQYLCQTGTPTFGYLVSNNWDNCPNLFGAYGSVLDYSTNGAPDAFVAKQMGAKSVAVIAYGDAAQSKDACQATVDGLKANGVNVGFQDLNLAIYGDPTADVQQMASAHTDLMLSCMDGTENLKFAQAIHQDGLTIPVIWLNGYDRSTIAQNAAALQNDVFFVQHVPFEAASEFPGKYPGMQQYIKEMNKYEPKWTYDDISFQGWVNAAQFVAGLRAAGKDLTQQKLVAAINQETAFTAGGVMAPVNWADSGHTKANPPNCSGFVQVKNGQPVVAFAQHGDQALVCFNGKNSTPVPLPAHVPPNT